MKPVNRRTFLKQTGGAVAATLLADATSLAASVDRSADLVLHGGSILTMDEARPAAKAMAVRGGRIVGVGSNKKIRKLIGSDTTVVDLDGKSVTPGLVDAHSHVMGFGQVHTKFVVVRPPKVNSFATLNAELAKAAEKKPPGEWIVARGFNTFKEDRFPRRQELDEAVPNHPVLAIHWSGQFAVANTMALKKANLLSADAKDPYGGKYLRDRRTGIPDGCLLHYPAIYSVHQPKLNEREQIECAEWGMKQFASQGVTCIHDNFCHPKYAAAYVRLERMGRLDCRVRVYPYVKNLNVCQRYVSKARRYSGRLVRLQGVKLAVDGYSLMYDVPPEHKHLAIPMHPQRVFNEIVATIHNADFQVDVHAVGDKGVDWALEAFAKAAGSKAACRKRRHRIEHFVFRKMDSIRRAADLGVPVCTQPTFIEMRGEDMRKKLGRKLIDTMLPARTFKKEGVHLAYGADVPAFPSHSPMASIAGAMDRRTSTGRKLNADEAESFLDALHTHTLSSAYAAFDDDDLGSLSPGKHADFVIWDHDLRKIRKSKDAAALSPQATYLAGEAVYEA